MYRIKLFETIYETMQCLICSCSLIVHVWLHCKPYNTHLLHKKERVALPFFMLTLFSSYLKIILLLHTAAAGYKNVRNGTSGDEAPIN